MAEFTGMTTVEYDGDHELDISKLPHEVKMDLWRVIRAWRSEDIINPRNMIVTIPITLSFETEVTIEVDPLDRSC